MTINKMAWLSGSWKGSLGPMTVEETWLAPLHGVMEMMIRLSTPEGIQMTEFIVVRETVNDNGEPSLLLHLRQFSADHELVTSQDMPLLGMEDNYAGFAAPPGSNITQLDYTHLEGDRLRVDVTMATGDVVTAELQRSE